MPGAVAGTPPPALRGPGERRGHPRPSQAGARQRPQLELHTPGCPAAGTAAGALLQLSSGPLSQLDPATLSHPHHSLAMDNQSQTLFLGCFPCL